jgi:hypothetical protein
VHPELPLVALYLTFLEAAAGGLAVLLLTDLKGEVTPGSLGLTAATLAAVATCALLLGAGLTAWLPAIVWPALAVAVLDTAAYGLLLWRRPSAAVARRAAGASALAGAVLATVSAGTSFPSAALGPIWSALAYLAGGLALGAATNGMLLGHWYLMTPRLTAKPLRRMCDLMLGAIGAQVLLGALGAFLSGAAAAESLAAGTAPWPAVPLGSLLLLRLGWAGAGVIFPVATGIAARVCCTDVFPRGRSMQAATGLLYLATGSVLAATLLANALIPSAGNLW